MTASAPPEAIPVFWHLCHAARGGDTQMSPSRSHFWEAFRMYENLVRGSLYQEDDTRPEAIEFHRGSPQDFLTRYQQRATLAAQAGYRGIREFGPRLVNRIADARTLRLAWDYLARNGGTAPGPNGHRYADYSSAEAWDLCRCLGKALRDGKYQPGPERILDIPKQSGQGTRPLVLTNVEDRVVQRAVVEILQPLMDPQFGRYCFGFRPRKSHLNALAHAKSIAFSQHRLVWTVADVKDAFLNVPVSQLLDVVRMIFRNNELVALLARILPSRRLTGIRQGGPLSPLMLNIYLHHFLDEPWRKRFPELPTIRVADDILLLSRNVEEAEMADAEIRRLLLPAGLRFKGTAKETVHDLDGGDDACWLGFRIRRASRGLRIELTEKAWRKLDSQLGLAHTKHDAPLRADRTLRAWLDQRGPCYRPSDSPKVCQRMIAMARAYAFEEVPSPTELDKRWQLAHEKWQELRRSIRPQSRAASAAT